MIGFDPATTLQHLKASYGVPRLLAVKFDETCQKRVLASYANGFVDSALECIIVGWNEPVGELLERAERWLHAAIEADEQDPAYVANLSESQRLRTLAMCRWLRQDAHDGESLNQAVAFLDAYYSSLKKLDRASPDIALPDYINAAAYERAVALYERSGRKPPSTARRAVREGCVSYVIAQHKLGRGYTEDGVGATISALLKRNVDKNWLAKGHHFDLAIWMKGALWEPGMSATATVVRCYDYMAGVVSPIVRGA